MCLWHMWSAPSLCHHPTQTKKQQRKWPLPSIVGPPRNKKLNKIKPIPSPQLTLTPPNKNMKPLIAAGHNLRKRTIRGPAFWIMKQPPTGRDKLLIFVKHFSIFLCTGRYPYFDHKSISNWCSVWNSG